MKEAFEKIKEMMEERLEEQYKRYAIAFLPEDRGGYDAYSDAIEIVNQVAEETAMGNISDGYHTFNELYHHRAVLFAVICNTHKELAWKSKLHDTGDMYDGMFIVGIETTEGQATYHYDIDPYWDMFKVKELPNAPKWDGHTPDEAIRRIGNLSESLTCSDGKDINVRSNDGWIACSEMLPKDCEHVLVCLRQGNVLVGHYIKDFEWYTQYGAFVFCDVIAWMPLPQAFKKGEEKHGKR